MRNTITITKRSAFAALAVGLVVLLGANHIARADDRENFKGQKNASVAPGASRQSLA